MKGDNKKDPEETFLTLLQRIQRQYNPVVNSKAASNAGGSNDSNIGGSNNNNGGGGNDGLAGGNNQLHHFETPPNEAASALGRQLALAFQAMDPVKKGIQEKALMGLANKYMNPSVTTTFFETLLSIRTINMEWLPAWIIYTEKLCLEDTADESYLWDALTTMIRAYPRFVMQISIAAASNAAVPRATTGTAVGPQAGDNVNTLANAVLGGIGANVSVTHSSHTKLTTTTSAAATAAANLLDACHQVATTYRRLQSSASRIAMLREFTKVAFLGDMIHLRNLLSPLMAASVLNVQEASTHESLLFLEGTWRESWTVMAQSEEEEEGSFMDIVEWMTESLAIFLLGIPCRPLDARLSCKDISHRWLVHILELGSFLAQGIIPAPSQGRMQTWLSGVVAGIVPRLFAIMPSYRIPLKPALSQIRSILRFMAEGFSYTNTETATTAIVETGPTAPFALDAVETLRLATLVLSDPIKQDVRELLRILAASTAVGLAVHNNNGESKVGSNSKQNSHPAIHSMLRGLGSMYLRDDICAAASTELIKVVTTVTKHNNKKQQQKEKRSVMADTSTAKVSSGTGPTPLYQGENAEVSNVIEFLMDETTFDVPNFVKFLSQDYLLDGSQFTAMQQSGALLLAVGLMGIDTPNGDSNGDSSNNSSDPDNNEKFVSKYHDASYAFMKNLLLRYPHLGVSLLPVLIDALNSACVRGDGTRMIHILDFLCDAVIQDLQCAREVWNLLGVELMKPATPSVIRASIIRIFPMICKANKRLYKRVIEVLGNNLAADDNVEVRLSVAATISDLAKEDQIRDVTDVIGWLQGFIVDTGWVRSNSTLDKELAPINATLVHYAILSLHYLVVAQELDFGLVLVVLNKRLCNVHDMAEVSKLPPLVLESLLLLLGDGECDDGSDEDGDDDDDDDEERTPKPIGVPPQVARSVETLVILALSPELDPSNHQDNSIGRATVVRCRRNILESLCNYTFDALGVDDEGLRAFSASVNNPEAPPLNASGIRYSAIRQVIDEGIALLESAEEEGMEEKEGDYDPAELSSAIKAKIGKAVAKDSAPVDTDLSISLASLISKFLKFEETVLGASLWQKRGRGKKGSGGRHSGDGYDATATVRPSQIAALPKSTRVQKMYHENSNTATALAAMLCFEGKPLSLLTDLAGDIANESSDPTIRAFTVQAWLNSARSLLTELVVTLSSSEGLDQILIEVRDWTYRLDNCDNMYLLLSALALYIPDILGPYGDHSSYVNEICDEVWGAFKNHAFESSDIGRLCLGFIGVCSVRAGDLDQVGEIVTTLQKSVSGYGGQASFGAYYGLGIIAQAYPELLAQRKADDSSHQDESAREDTDEQMLAGGVIGFLITELIACVKGSHEALESLVECIKNARITPEVIDALTDLGKNQVTMLRNRSHAAKSLFISFALCLPALVTVNDELLLGVYCLLESLPWGSGKGIALPSVLHACRHSGLFEPREIEKIYAKYAKVFEEGMDQGVDGLDDIFYAVTATITKTIPYSIRRFLVGNRSLFDEDGRAISLLAAAVSLSTLPCLGCGTTVFTDSARLSPIATKDDINDVMELISEAASIREWNKYSQVAVLLLGFMASIGNFHDVAEVSTRGITTGPYATVDSRKLGPSLSTASSSNETKVVSQLPTAQPGTVLEVVMLALAQRSYPPTLDKYRGASRVFIKLLGCFEGMSLPGNFVSFLEQFLKCKDDIKFACTKLLISQIRGRPRAVFDGRDYMDLTLRVSKLPMTNLRSILGEGEATKIFIRSYGEIVPRFPVESVDEAVENVWRLCINQVGTFPEWTVIFLTAMAQLLRESSNKRSFNVAPKTLNSIRMFLLRRAFAGIRDAPWAATNTATSANNLSIVEAYANSLMEMPITSLIDAEFFALKDLDGFIGEALRNRCVMSLVRQGYFTTPSRASSEISSAIAWFSRQLVASEDEIFSSTLLQIACSIAEATARENSDRKRELLFTLMDNLLLTASSASYVGIQMLSVLVFRWCKGSGSDGDMSLGGLISSSRMEKWHELSPSNLHQIFHILVHDLPFHLSTYAKKEKLSGVVFNRLFRIYDKWQDDGADEETLDCIRKALICCRSVESGGEDFAYLATSMLL